MKIKILLVGSMTNYNIYEKPLMEGLKANNCIVKNFRSFDPFKLNFFNYPKHIFQERLRISFFLKKKNISLINKVKIFKPDIVFLWRTTTILPWTLNEIKRQNPNIKIYLYHNDNPYIGFINYIKYRHYLNSIRYSDITYVYRPSDQKYVLKYFPKKVFLLKPNYISYLHKPNPKNKKINDVIFVGHFANDRAKLLNELYINNIKFEVYGNGWLTSKYKNLWKNIKMGREIKDKDYVKKICSSKIAIGFLSKKNKDVYTRRCFEIPACKTLLIAPKTREIQKILKNDIEVVLWNNSKDFIKKIKFLLKNKRIIKRISLAGYLKMTRGNHSEIHRAKEILKKYARN